MSHTRDMDPSLKAWLQGQIDNSRALLKDTLREKFQVHHRPDIVQEIDQAVYALNRARNLLDKT